MTKIKGINVPDRRCENRMLREMIKRSVFNWKMVVACGLGIALLYHEMIFGWVNLRGIIFESDYYSGLEDFFMLFAWSSYIIYAGIFPGISYGFSFLEERKSGYLQMIRQRISVTKYVWYKVIAVGISGGVCTGITFLVSVGPIQFFTRNSSRVAFQNNDKQLIWQRIMEAYGKDSVYLFRFILMILFGVLWAEAALLISLLVKNRYIAFALYFVVYELEFLLLPNPVESACMLRYDADYGDSLLVPYLYFACGIVAVAVVILLIAKRQVKHEKL